MKFSFNIEPMSQSRPRFAHRGKLVVAYDQKKVKEYKQQIGLIATARMQDLGLEPLDGPLMVLLTFYRPIQKSISKVEHVRRQSGKKLPIVKADIDNYIKAVLDACNSIVWKDDNSITDISAKKRYSTNPRIEMEVLQLAQQK